MNSSLATSTPPSATALIVDDEKQSIVNLSALLSEYCPEIRIIDTARSAEAARELIASTRPDILFLDIRMPGENGFDLLESLADHSLILIFVTAFNHYAIQAIRASAFDYIMKPVSVRELKRAVDRAIQTCQKRKEPEYRSLYGKLLQNLTASICDGKPLQHIALPTSEGLIIQEMSKIIRLEADGSYTTIIREGENNLVLSRPLREFELILDPTMFARIHNSHMINIAYLHKYDRKDGGYAVMKDTSRIPVSRRRTPQFLEWIQQQTRYV